MEKSTQLTHLFTLIRDHRWAALATIGKEGQAEASMVAYAVDDQHAFLYFHLSQLAAHSRNLQRHPDASLVISEADTGRGDPQQLARVTLFGQAILLQQNEPEYEGARRHYLQCLPSAAPRFDFADFNLFRFAILTARFVGGFAQAYSYNTAELENRWKGAQSHL